MKTSYSEIWTLCDFLEAELEGRPYDRSLALELATRLGVAFPGIKNSMNMLCQRVSQDQQEAVAA